MQFKSVILKHFMSFEMAERRFEGTGLTLIEGENGAGKSSLWDAISWCLFGQTVRGIGADEVVHRAFEKDCAVIVGLDSGETSYLIRRYRKHTGKDKQGAFGNRLIVEMDGDESSGREIVEKSDVAATQRWLIETLGIDFDLFRCTVLFAQEERFNFVSETDKKQKEILSKVRRVDFGKGLVNARQAIKDHDTAMVEIERKLAVLKSHVSEDAVKALKTEAYAWEAERENRLAECNEKIKEQKAELKTVPAEVSLAEFTAVKAKINAVISNRQAARRTAQLRKTDIEQRQGYTVGRFNELKKLKDQCPTCEQPIEAARLTAKLEELRLQRIALVHEAGDAAKMIRKQEEEIEELNTKLAAVNGKERDQRMWVELRKRHEARIEELTLERDVIRDEENPVEVKIAEAKEKQKRIKAKIEELATEKVVAEERLPYLQFWEQGYGDKGIKSFLFDTVCGTLTAKANHYLGILSDGLVSVSFDTQTALKSGETRERFECQVMVEGEAVSYASYSGGEKTRISLAVDMALCDLMSDSHGSSFNIVVFDEQDEWLDVQGLEAYLRLLKERAKTQRVFVVSHDSELKSRFEDVWTVVKEDRVSRFAA